MSSVFQPATSEEIKQRQKQKIKWLIEMLLSRSDCIRHNDGSYSFTGSVCLSYMNLTEIPIKFKHVDGYFDCDYNQLTSLKNAPEYVGRDFYCYNSLMSLDGCPKVVEGDFVCSNNKLITLKNVPKITNSNFNCSFFNQIKFTKEDVRKVCNVKGKIYV